MDVKGLGSLCFLLLLPAFLSFASGIDSLGISSKENRVYVVHQVEAGETLYSLSKRYHTSVSSIVDNNQLTNNGLAVGAVINIPWKQGLTHRVQPGETLYALSEHYQVSIDNIKKVNKLSSNELELGMILIILLQKKELPAAVSSSGTQGIHIVEQKETLYSISKKYDLELELLRSWNQLSDDKVQVGDTLWLSQADPPKVNEIGTAETGNQPTAQINSQKANQVPRAVVVNNTSGEVAPVKETGMAAVIDGRMDSRKYLALHPTAPVGTIMRVRNEMTNLSVFVRVVGKLPATGTNDKVLIRVSPAAQEALGALDEKFRVELSYVPNQ